MTPCYPLALVSRWLLLVVLLLSAFLASQVGAFAQSATATLSGTVTDPNNAVVPGAHVTATNTGTGLKREATTGGSGTFTIPLLPPSTYTVLIENQGFTPAEIKDVVLNVGDNVALNIQLKVGQVGAIVDVKSDASLINESLAVGTVVDRQFVGNLPLNGRTFQSLIALAPGIVLTSTPLDDGQFSVNGQRADANYFTVDGVSANIGVNPVVNPGQAIAGSTGGFSALGTTSNLVSIDAMQEFRVQTSTFAPEFGRTPGAQVVIVTRSGTNQFHGSAFDYFRNDALDANDWFANSRNQKKAALRQNDFGAVFGGPIIKNRTFFFFSYEGLRLRLPQAVLTQVPSVNSRQLAVPGAQPFLKAFPLPNGRDLANDVSEFLAAFSDPSSLDSTGIRVDHAIGNKLMLFGRYSYAPSNTSARAATGRSASTLFSQRFKTQTITGGLTMAIAPTISNDVRLNYSKNTASLITTLDDFAGAIPVADSLLFPATVDPKNSQFAFNVLGLTSGSWGKGRFDEQVQRQINVVDTISLQVGSHQLKFGGDYRRLFPISTFFQYAPSLFTNGVSGAIAGIAFVGSISATPGHPLFPVFLNLSFFGQDTWKISRRLTLTYGMRWDVNPPPREKNGRDPLALASVNDPGNLAFSPQGTPLYQTTYDNFAPRVGAAYLVSQRKGRESVLRGGFGVFYDLGSNQAAIQLGNSFPNVAGKVFFNAPLPLDPVSAAPPTINLNPPFTATVSGIDPNLKLPYTYQWNLAVEQSIGPNQTLTATYVAAVGHRLLRQERILNPNPNFAAVNLTRSDATSNYRALQLEFQRRLSRGLQALVSYTWSHSIDNVSSDSFLGAPTAKVSLDQEQGPSSFDIRHVFNLGATYDIPQIRGDRVIGALLRRWSVDSIFRARSALPVNVVTGSDPLGLGASFGGAVSRPDLIPGIDLYISDSTVPGGRRINKAAFDAATPIAAKRQGTLGRNALRGFGMWQLDLGLRRQFSLTERLKLQLRAEAFNIFNHPNFADPGMGVAFAGTNVLTNLQFGQSISMLARGQGGQGLGLNPLYQVGGTRSIQLALKLVF